MEEVMDIDWEVKNEKIMRNINKIGRGVGKPATTICGKNKCITVNGI